MSFASRLLDSFVLTPQGDVTKINREDFRNLDKHLKPGDRIAWHRPYMLIHEAIVLKVDAEKSEVWVFEKTKTGSSSSSSVDSDTQDGSGISKITKVNLISQSGQLYRYNDTEDPDSLNAILRQVLTKLDKRGYNLFALNCQTSASGVKTHGKDKNSHQTRWFAVTQTIEAVGIPLLSEKLEAHYGGEEWIGIVSAGILHAFAFVIELITVLLKYKRVHMSWHDLRTVISRQLLMHVVGWFGNYLSSFAEVREVLKKSGTLSLVLSFFFAIVADALFLYAGLDPDSWWRYPVNALGAITGFCLGFAATGACLEFLVSMILGFAGKFVGHGLYHAGSWLFEWLTSESFKGQYVKDISQLQEGDHITTYEGFWHPHCHAIFEERVNGKMKIIRNTYRNGVIEDVVPFCPNWVYRYDYPPERLPNNEDVVRIARSHIGGSNKYSWTSYNCKTFAEHCKLVHASSGSNTINWEVHYNAIMDDSSISTKDKKNSQAKFRKFQTSLSSEQSNPNEIKSGAENQRLEHESKLFLDEQSNIQNDMTSQRKGKEDKTIFQKQRQQSQKSLSEQSNNDKIISGQENHNAVRTGNKSNWYPDEQSKIQNDTSSQKEPSDSVKPCRKRRPIRSVVRSLICIN